MDVRSRAVRRWVAAAIAVTVASSPVTVGASPHAPAGASGPAQEAPETDDRDTASSNLVDVDVLVATNASAVATALSDLGTDIQNQLDAYHTAQAAVATAEQALADADNALTDTQFRIEETTAASDQVVIEAFVNPPAEDALEVLTTESLSEATVRQTLLGWEADQSAASLTDLQEALATYEEQAAAQEEALAVAEAARQDAEIAFADLEASLSAQAEFVTAVEAALAEQAGQPLDPAGAARAGEITTLLTSAAEARAAADAARRAEEERQERIRAGIMFCPVAGPVDFIDSWGYARSGGRTHKGVDMMADIGVPTVAPVSGRVEHRGSSLGGLSWYVYGDNGNMYYGTHLSGYENQGAGHVEGGTVIGYVGDSGNAAGTPHLHFEIHPGGGSAVNPYPATAEACFG
ncbi:MAG TPA: peptidoglycan DD-metalloendopeptidase family protein [Acidimicrobiales bacterium]|nr:peptidoglycan DD-metalloendopeptidase family protein [Acidimicrobiales bacterium]